MHASIHPTIHPSIRPFISQMHARQAEQAELVTYWSNQLYPTKWTALTVQKLDCASSL